MREVGRALRAWLKIHGSFPGPIFLSRQKRPIDRTTLHVLMKKYGAAAGILEELRHFHVLKHSCAKPIEQGVQLMHNGVQTKTVFEVEPRINDPLKEWSK